MTQQVFGFGITAGDAGERLIVQQGDRIAPLATLVSGDVPATVIGLLPQWDEWVDRVSDALPTTDAAAWMNAGEVVMLAPLVPPTVYCAGTNFHDHVAEMRVRLPDKASEPLVNFNVPSAALTGHRQPVERPAGTEKLDWEVELAAVIGRAAWRVSAQDAMSHVAGYTVANDVSIRDPTIFHDVFGVRWLFSKGQAGMKPIGPTVIPARFVADPMKLALSLHVNGDPRQESNTSEMIWSLAEQIEAYSHMVQLRPGDLLLTGTPAGTAAARGVYLADGDEMVAAVQGVGTLVNRVAPSSNGGG